MKSTILQTLYSLACKHEVVIDIYASKHNKYAVKHCIKCDKVFNISYIDKITLAIMHNEEIDDSNTCKRRLDVVHDYNNYSYFDN
jgi:hypothetical protein